MERLWSHVAIGEPDECWPWTGALSKKRRGRRGHIRACDGTSKTILVCRAVCEDTHGPAPSPDHEAGHTCPVREHPLCCNPRHLVWMDRFENERHKATYR